MKLSSGDVFVKIPKMQMGKNQGDKTVLMSGFKSWHSSEDLYSIVDDLMGGTVTGKVQLIITNDFNSNVLMVLFIYYRL